MAVATTTITTAVPNTNGPNAVTALYQKTYKKIAGDLVQGFNFATDEAALIDALPKESMPVGRENLLPVDLNEEAGVASIPEGGYEARPTSVGLEESFVSTVQLNKRFNMALLVKYLDAGKQNMLERQIKLQGSKAVQAMAATKADFVWGSSSGILALTSTTVSGSSATIGLTGAFGNANITSAIYAAKMFKVGDYIALLNSGALIANSIGLVTARDTVNGTITVTFTGSVASTSAGAQIVKANSMENTTVAGTDYNKAFVGVQDGFFAPSLHSLSHPNWTPAGVSTAAGRMTGIKLHAAADEIANQGGADLTDVWMDQGVYRDMIALERAAVRFNDPMSIEIDGAVKSKGRTIKPLRRCPPGYVVCMAKGALYSWFQTETPSAPAGYDAGKEYIDQNAIVFRIEQVGNLVWRNRKKTYLFTNQTAQ